MLALSSARHFAMALTCLGALLTSACSYMPKAPKVDVIDASSYKPVTNPAVAPVPVNGSLYQAASYRPGFEDRRARLVGDLLTIQIAENITASQSSTSNIDRSAKNSGAITALPFLKANITDKLNIGATSDNSFAGKGDTTATNSFTGTITATVIQVLPNGHLVIAGDKQIGVNQNVDVLQFSGTVDPRMVQPGNIISSSQVANVRVASRGRGAQDDAQTIGWLSRFFLTVLPF